MSCDPTPGKYNILSSVDGNSVNTCPSLAPANVAILDDATDVTLVQYQGPPSCTYEIKINGGYVVSSGEQDLLQISADAPLLWLVNKVSDGVYTILLNDNHSLAWTDPGGTIGCTRQLALAALENPAPNSQLFKFMPV